MKLLVAGGRDYNREQHAFTILDLIHVFGNLGPVSLVIHGASKGADALASEWAKKRGIEQAVFPADWEAYGKFAGPRRNGEMLAMKPDLAITFAGGRGTADVRYKLTAAGFLVKTSDEILLEWSDGSGVFKKGGVA